ncbi:MAG: hypothetical protein ACRD2A_24420, partial [Vicinamibacterales bacterium]
AYQYIIGYDEANLTVDAQLLSNAAVNVMFRNAGSSIFNGSNPVPDTNSDNIWSAAAIDNGAGIPESGSGVLERLSLSSDAVAVAGLFPLTLSENVHLDANGAAFAPLITNAALVAINVACSTGIPSSTPLPSATSTPSPTPTFTPTLSPRPSGSPTPPACILDDNDFDNDGRTNNRDRDDDNDGVKDGKDIDDDNDGLPDRSDPDDDNDRIPDRADHDDGKLYCG